MKSRIILVVLAALFSVQAQAEIYRCLSDQGQVSYGDAPCPERYLSGNAMSAKVWTQMRLLASEGLKVNAKLGPDVYSIMACLDESARYNSKLDQLESPLRELPEKQHTGMYTAMEHLRVCGECRVSAPHYCAKARQSLFQETAYPAIQGRLTRR